MAIYFNDELLHPRKDGNELEQRYHDELEELDALYKKKGGEITLVRKAKKQWDKDKTSFRPVVPFALPTAFPIYLEGIGAISVRYSEYPPERRENNRIVWPPTRNFIEERLTLTKQKRDLAWFLIKATKFVRTEGNNDALTWIDDPNAEIIEQASKVKRTVKIDRLLLDDESPLLNEKSLQLIADRFDIDITELDEEVSGFVLRDAIVKADDAKNPDVNIPMFLDFAGKLLKPKKAKKKPEVKKEPAPEAEKTIYTAEQLDAMTQKELNEVAKHFKVKYPPQNTRIEMTAEILEKQLATQATASVT